MEKSESYLHEIPNETEFAHTRHLWRTKMGNSKELRSKAIELTVASSEFHYGYQWEWCGVPIIRHPDDIVLQQEIMWSLKPTHVVETGVARGGSLALSASLIEMSGKQAKVLGLDIQILPHALEALKPWTLDGRIQLLECDSISSKAVRATKSFLIDSESPVLLVLDSNHSHEHVLLELTALTPLLTVGSIVVVADTIIEEMPEDYYPNRPWTRGNNPLSAVKEFLKLNSDFELDERWSKRGLMGECRDGILVKTKESLSPR
jgi:cephalosporin hydroxylase